MSWRHVARKDFEDAGRSLLLWVVTALMLVLVVGLTVIPRFVDDFHDPLAFLFSPIGFFVPIIGLMVGYRSIVGERESGTVRFLLGLPNTRGDVLVGKIIGRTAVVAVPTLISFVVGALVIVALYGELDVANFLGLLVFSVVMGLLYVSIAVGVSASVSSRAKALAGVVGVYVFFEIVWDFVPVALLWLLEGVSPAQFQQTVPGWYLFLERLSPGNALSVISMTLVDFPGTEDFDMAIEARYAGETVPLYLETWSAWLVVLLWIAVPLGIGYLRFRRATLS